MDKQTIEREMKAFMKGSSYITAKKLAEHLKKGKAYAYKVVDGLDKLPGEQRWTMYFIPDVAQRLMEMRRQ